MLPGRGHFEEDESEEDYINTKTHKQKPHQIYLPDT